MIRMLSVVLFALVTGQVLVAHIHGIHIQGPIPVCYITSFKEAQPMANIASEIPMFRVANITP